MTSRARTLLITALLGIGVTVGLAPMATADTVGPIDEPRINAAGGRGACVAVQGVDGWCVVNPFKDLPKTPPLP